MADLAQQLANLQSALKMGGEHNEGTSGDRGDVWGPGDTYESFTWPKNAETVDDEGEGLIKYHYDGRLETSITLEELRHQRMMNIFLERLLQNILFLEKLLLPS